MSRKMATLQILSNLYYEVKPLSKQTLQAVPHQHQAFHTGIHRDRWVAGLLVAVGVLEVQSQVKHILNADAGQS